MSTEQWKKHPFNDSIKTNLTTKLKKFGEIFVYNPIFYNFQEFNPTIKNKKYNTNYEFVLKQTNLEEHCKKLFAEVYPIDTEFILISHSGGYMIAHVFASMFKDYVKGLININGGFSKDWIKLWLEKDNIQIIKKIKDKELKELFYNLTKGKLVNESIKVLNQVVKYNIFKQHKIIEHDLNCPIFIFTNVNTKHELETLDKFKFSNDISILNDDVKCFYFLDKSDFLYFEIDKHICEIVEILVKKCNEEQKNNYN